VSDKPQGSADNPVQLDPWQMVVDFNFGTGWGILAIDMPQNEDLSNAQGFFPIGPFTVGEHIDPNTYFADPDTGQLDKFNWLWFAQIPPLPPVLSTLYDVVTKPARDRWFIDGYIDAPAERNPGQDATLAEQTEELNTALGYSYTEDLVGNYIRVDPETTEDPATSVWAGTGDYPVPQTIYKKLTAPKPDREFRYWYRFDPTEPVKATKKEVRLTYILNFVGGPPAFEEPESIINVPGHDEHLPDYTMKFKLDIYTRDVDFEVKATTIEGPEAQRRYSQTREVSINATGAVVTIGKSGFV
jgi:hypothetical protein